MKNVLMSILMAVGTVLAPMNVLAYTSGGYVSSFTVNDINIIDLGGGSYNDPIVLDANGGQGGPLLIRWVNDYNFYRDNGYWEQYELPSCPFTRDGFKFSGWKVYDGCYVGNEEYRFVDSNGTSRYIGGLIGTYSAWGKIDICGYTALVAQWRDAPKFGEDGYARSFCVDDLESEYNEDGDYYDSPILLVPNGGEGSSLLAKGRSDRLYKMPDCPFKREGYEFVGWKMFNPCRDSIEESCTITSCILPSGETFDWSRMGYDGTWQPGEWYDDVCGTHVLVAQWREKQMNIMFGDKWYEALADDGGTTLVGWKQFYMGANVAIPVTVTDGDGNNYALSSDDITIKPGTFIDYGEPYVMSESDMWDVYGSQIFDVRNAGSRIDIEKDDGVWVYNNWDWEDITGVTYELEKGIWPFFDRADSDYDDVNDWIAAHSDRQWIIIPTGNRPQKGLHTFTVAVRIGGKTETFAVSFTMNPDQKAKAATVLFNANGGKVSEYGRVVNLNAAVGELPIPERLGYTFKGWFTAKTKGSKISALAKVTKAVTYYAQWTPRKYWVYYNGKKTGTINTGSGTKMSGMGKYAVGSKVTIKVTPVNKSWVFCCWDWGMPDSLVPKKWYASSQGSEYTTFTFTMPPEDVQIVGYGMKKGEDFAPKFSIDCGGAWYVEDCSSIRISIDSGSFPKLNTNKTIPPGMKLARVAECEWGYQCQYVLKVSDWSKLPRGTVKTVKLTATNRSGKKTTKSFKIVMPNKTQAVDKGVLELNTSTVEPYQLKAGVKFSWNDLEIAAADGWTISSITGIPGLTWDAKKQKMTGVPSKAGIYAAAFTVAKGKTKYTATATFAVEALPKEVVGTFYGFTSTDYDWDDSNVEIYDDTGYYVHMKDARMEWYSKNVSVTVSSAGKITAKVGGLVFVGTGLLHLSNSVYKVSLRKSQKIKSGRFKGCKQSWLCEFEIDGAVSWDSIQLKGVYWSLGHPCAASMGGPECMVARMNVAMTDATAKTIATKYAKLGKQGLIVFKANSDSGYSYDLECPGCVETSKKAEVFIKVDKTGKATLSGKIAGTKVSGTTYLTYEHIDENTIDVFVRFFIGKFVIEIEGDTEYFCKNGSMNGRVWKK